MESSIISGLDTRGKSIRATSTFGAAFNLKRSTFNLFKGIE